MKEPSLPICLSCQIEKKNKKPLFTTLWGGGEGGGLYTTEAKWFMIESQRHSYHLVDPSPWPYLFILRDIDHISDPYLHFSGLVWYEKLWERVYYSISNSFWIFISPISGAKPLQ